MKVSELIELLQRRSNNEDLEVKIVDGYRGVIYGGNFAIEQFEDLDGKITLDIGIGGCEETEDEQTNDWSSSRVAIWIS